MKKAKKDLYETLGVDKNAEKETIKKAFRDKAKQAHPDAGGNSDDFAALVKAKDILGDDAKRRRYDETGETDGGQSDEHHARAMLVKAMFEITRKADDLDSVPLITAMAHSIEAEQDQAHRNIKEAQKAIENITGIVKRLQYSGDGRSHLHEVLEAQKSKIEDEIRSQQENIRLADIALEMLDDYDYEADIQSSGYATFSLNAWMAGR